MAEPPIPENKRKDKVARWFMRQMPSRESLQQSRMLRPVAHLVLDPALWRLTRRSVPRGVALGTLVGIFIMIPGLQMAAAALLAFPVRANVPLSMAMTFLSMPATTPFILIGAVYIGNAMLGFHADVSQMSALMERGASIGEWIGWLMSDAAPAMLFGLFVIAVVSAAFGYVASAMFWRWRIAAKWRRRSKRHVVGG